jgi:hypothetical protein
VDVSFADYDHRQVNYFESMKWMQDIVPKALPGWKVSVKQQQEGPPQGYPVSFEVSGDDFDRLAVISEQV